MAHMACPQGGEEGTQLPEAASMQALAGTNTLCGGCVGLELGVWFCLYYSICRLAQKTASLLRIIMENSRNDLSGGAFTRGPTQGPWQQCVDRFKKVAESQAEIMKAYNGKTLQPPTSMGRAFPTAIGLSHTGPQPGPGPMVNTQHHQGHPSKKSCQMVSFCLQSAPCWARPSLAAKPFGRWRSWTSS